MKFSLKSILFMFWLSIMATVVYFYLLSGMTFIQLSSDLQNLISSAGPGATIAFDVIFSGLLDDCLLFNEPIQSY